MENTTTRALILTMMISVGAALGCAPSGDVPAAGGNTPDPSAATESEGAHSHGGWWCAEHGVPEGICGQCNAKLAAEFQRNGDWCKQHDRPDSQCFACHPELEATFAARYEAKMGTKPPTPEG